MSENVIALKSRIVALELKVKELTEDLKVSELELMAEHAEAVKQHTRADTEHNNHVEYYVAIKEFLKDNPDCGCGGEEPDGSSPICELHRILNKRLTPSMSYPDLKEMSRELFEARATIRRLSKLATDFIKERDDAVQDSLISADRIGRMCSEIQALRDMLKTCTTETDWGDAQGDKIDELLNTNSLDFEVMHLDTALKGMDAIGFWMSAALEDPAVCAEMKRDIKTFFEAREKLVGFKL